MEDELSRFFKFKWSKNKIGATLLVLIILCAIAGGGYLFHSKAEGPHPFWDSVWDVYVNLFASLCAFVAAFLIVRFISWVFRRHEDEIKVSYKNSKMLSIYKNDYKEDKKHEYRKEFPLHPTKEGQKKEPKCIVYCKELFFAKDCKVLIEDLPDEHFEVDTFIQMHAPRLLGAHSASKTVNEITPRLNDCVLPTKENNNTATLQITRSTYLNHLLTNRVLDYPIAADVTLRRLYEEMSQLTELKRSKMSNHIGINALVFLTGEGKKYLIIPKRGKKATVVKNGVTASIASRLTIKDYNKAIEDESLLSFIEGECIKKCAAEKLLLETRKDSDEQKVKAKKVVDEMVSMQVNFLGLARDPYEGGKPTLFYYVEWPISRKTFGELAKGDYKAEDIDEIVKLMIEDWDNIQLKVPKCKKCEKKRATEEDRKKADEAEAKRYDKARLVINGKPFIFEQNLMANFWFYLKHKGEIEDEKA